METGDYIAIYAAIVATGALAWNIYAAWTARRRRVEVSVEFAMVPTAGGEILQVVMIRAVNNGQSSVRADSAGLYLQDGSGRTLVSMQSPAGATMPGVIEPNHSAWTYMLVDEVEGSGFDLGRPLTGWVRLATGEEVRSKSSRLLA